TGSFDRQFIYKDKGAMATIGRNRAVADLKGIHLYGRVAWFAWMFVHLISLLGMRNKLTVLINWTWAYFSYSSSLRLLIRPDRYPLRSRWGER
ncbi:MAG: NAD(P)/FAD-dependent oxidoreductase, partial [Muribaculaceae bacterium]|nr:NAD(P)/FAD-dependent oxidoreductase [Muribaculaceae bacterium]